MTVREIRSFVLRTALLGICLSGKVDGADPSTDLQLTSPKDYQVFQRGSRISGKAVIEGDAAVVETSSTTRVEIRFVSNQDPGKEIASWVPISMNPVTHHFKGDVPLPAGGWYTAEVRIRHGELWAEVVSRWLDEL